MARSFKSVVVKTLKITGITVVSILLLMVLLPVLFPGKIVQEVKAFANRKLNGELNFKEAKLSFFHHFPSLTLTLTDFDLKGSAPYRKESLLSSDEIAFGINVKSLVLHGEINIDKIFIANAFVNVKVNPKGEANYNVYVSDNNNVKTKDSSNTSLRLEKIVIENSHILYNDSSTNMLIDAKGFNYTGNGDLNNALFDLHTDAVINDFNFSYGGEVYLKNKNVHAQLITQINTNSLAFIFQQNNIKINKLPVDFNGKFDFLSNGYDMDFTVKSENSLLNDFFTALPPAYVTWLDKARVQGSTDLRFTLKGKYIAANNQMPDAAFTMKIRNGFINYNQAPFSASNIFLNFETKIPGLDPEKLLVNIDSIFFNLDKDYFKAIVHSEGLTKPNINARVNANIDLEKMNRTFGVKTIDLRGILKADIDSKGVYDKARKQLPVITGELALKNGYVKTKYYPDPVQAINLAIGIYDKTGTMKDLKVTLDPASFEFEGKPVYIKAHLENFENISYDIDAKGELDVAKIYKVFSQKGLDLDGYIKADVSLKGRQSDAMKGNYQRLKNKGYLALKNIKTTSDYLPKPFIITEGLFTFEQDKMHFKDFKAVYGRSDFKMNGYMQNVINFALTEKAVLKGKFSFDSRYINVDEFMSAKPVAAATTTPSATAKPAVANGVVIIPANLDLQLIALVGKVGFGELVLNKLKGNLTLQKGQLQLKQSGFNLIGCNVLMDVLYGSKTPKKAFFDFNIKADSFDVKRAYKEVKMFREMATAAANAEGIISLDYRVAGDLDANMQPVYASLAGGGTLSVMDVKMKGYKLFNAVSKQTGKDAMNNPNLKELKIHTTIKNNIVTIERFKFKVAGFRPRIEGQTSFDGNLALKMRLGLPPFGIIGIPLTITGNKDNPKVKIGKQMDELKETEYDNDVPLPPAPAEAQ
jgi:AsmA protein